MSMSRQELEERVAKSLPEWERIDTIYQCLVGILTWVISFGLVWIFWKIEVLHAKHDPTVKLVAGIGSILMLIVLIVQYLAGWKIRRELRKCGLVCDGCKTTLDSQLISFALATGRCGKCNALIMDRETAEPEEEPPMERDTPFLSLGELKRRVKCVIRARRIPCIILSALAVPLFLFGVVLAAHFHVFPKPRLVGMFVLLVAMLAIAMAIRAICGYTKASWKRLLRKQGLLCPKCFEPLVNTHGEVSVIDADFTDSLGVCRCGKVILCYEGTEPSQSNRF